METMKNRLIYLLQKLLGYNNYLFVFSLYKFYIKKIVKQDPEFLKFLELISETDNVLDIGANVGSMSAWLAKKAKKGKIFAFEPIPSNYHTLKRVLGFLGLNNVKVINKALGSENKEISMVLPIRDNVRKHGYSHILSENRRENEGEIYRIQQVTIDSIKELQDLPIAAIKIDVENHEYFVLKGALELIKNNRPIIFCELWRNHVREQVHELLAGFNYKMQIVEDNEFIDYNPKLHYNRVHTDFILVPVELSDLRVNEPGVLERALNN